MKKLYLLFVFVFLAGGVFALPTQYRPLALKADSYMSQAEYYFKKGRTEQVVVSQTKPEGQRYAVVKGEDPGKFYYQTTQVMYNETDVNKALEYLTYGIEDYPNRLDMYLLKLNICQQVGLTDCMVQMTASTLSRASKIRNKWRQGGVYGGTDLLPNGRGYMLSRLQGAAASVFAQGDLSTAKKMTRKILNYYPNYTPSLTAMGEIYMKEGNYKSAESVLKKAVNLDKNDTYARDVLSALYEQTGKTSEAAKYDIESSRLKRGK